MSSEPPVPKFQRAPFSAQVFTGDRKKKFDQLPDHSRHFIDQILDHGDLSLAAKKSGLAKNIKEVNWEEHANMSMREALIRTGLTPLQMAFELKECLSARVYKKGSDGNPEIDLRFKLKVSEFIIKLFGELTEGYNPKKDEMKNYLELFEDDK
jgi:hypothetical protein